jgi:Flp pilus assembly pilin Flp
MRGRNKSGQATLEMTLLIAAVIAVIVMVLFNTGGIKDKIQAGYNKTGDALNKTTNDLTAGVFQP